MPLALVASSGEAHECNAAFRELARGANAPLSLVALFGAQARMLLEGAHHGPSGATLPLVNESSERWFRVTLSPHEDGETWTAVMADVTDETVFHLRHRDCDRDFQLLREIGASLAECTDLDAITANVCEQVARVSRSPSFYVALYDPETQIVSFPRYLEEGVWKEKVSRPLSNGLTEYVLRTGEPLQLDGDVAAKARALGAEALGPSSRSWVGAPMIVNGEVLGMIAMQDARRSNRFDHHDVAVLSVIAGQAASAVKQASLIAASHRAYEKLSETQERLLESERARGVTEAVGAMNHEINNPLAAIVGNAQLMLRRKDPATEALTQKLESILTAARRIQEVTGKMSTLIQATSMPYPGETAILDIRRSVAEGDTCELSPPAEAQGGA